jgi:hypothetical protein
MGCSAEEEENLALNMTGGRVCTVNRKAVEGNASGICLNVLSVSGKLLLALASTVILGFEFYSITTLGVAQHIEEKN